MYGNTITEASKFLLWPTQRRRVLVWQDGWFGGWEHRLFAPPPTAPPSGMMDLD